MKRTFLAVALCATSALVAAQQPAATPAPAAVPAPKCEPKPQRPGESLLNDPRVRRQFERDVKVYGDCMKQYIEEHKAIALTHHNAANAAIEEYNRTVDSLNPQADKGSKSGPGTSQSSTPPRQGY